MGPGRDRLRQVRLWPPWARSDERAASVTADARPAEIVRLGALVVVRYEPGHLP
jgi:hypothetical protein